MDKLRQFRVDRDILVLFYQSFVESILTFCSIVWVNMSSKIAGQQQNHMTMTCDSQVLRKGQAIIRDVSHPLFSAYELLASGRWYRVPFHRTNWARRSFVPISIELLNKLGNNNY